MAGMPPGGPPQQGGPQQQPTPAQAPPELLMTILAALKNGGAPQGSQVPQNATQMNPQILSQLLPIILQHFQGKPEQPQQQEQPPPQQQAGQQLMQVLQSLGLKFH